MPIMPLTESFPDNFNKSFEEKRRRKRKRRSTTPQSDDSDKSNSPSCSNRQRSRTPKKTCRHFERSYNYSKNRSGDRSIKLRRLKEREKQSDHCHRDSRESSNEKEESAYSSRKTSPSKNTSQKNSDHKSTTSRSESVASNNNQREEPLKDEDGHLIYRTGDWVYNRYKVQKLLGEGTFGKCLECYDKKHDQIVALKVIRDVRRYREAAKLEIHSLKQVLKKDPRNDHYCIKLFGYFYYYGHACLVFPKLGKSVYNFMKDNLYQPFRMSQVQHISYQLLDAVSFLHSIKLTHTDLKTENILFVDSSYQEYWSSTAKQMVRVVKHTDIKLIDFGCATFEYEHHSSIVSTRHYRAPEVILELGWSHPCDVWSCGCIIFELFTGNTLFQTHDNREHLAMMERILGKMPENMIKLSESKYFSSSSCRLDWNWKSSDGAYVKANCAPLKHTIEPVDERSRGLYDLTKRLLEYDPKKRLTANEGLKHQYFSSMSSKRR